MLAVREPEVDLQRLKAEGIASRLPRRRLLVYYVHHLLLYQVAICYTLSVTNYGFDFLIRLFTAFLLLKPKIVLDICRR